MFWQPNCVSHAGPSAHGVLLGLERGEPSLQSVHLWLRPPGHRLEHQHPCPAAREVTHFTRTQAQSRLSTFVSATPAVDFKWHIHVASVFHPSRRLRSLSRGHHPVTSVENSMSWILCIFNPALSALRSCSVVNFLPVLLPRFYMFAWNYNSWILRDRDIAETFVHGLPLLHKSFSSLVVFLLCNVLCTDGFILR